MVLSTDGIFHVENRGNRTADQFAIIDRHRAIGTFGHDLQGLAIEPRKAHAYQPKAQRIDEGLDDGSHFRINTRLANDAFIRACCERFCFVFLNLFRQPKNLSKGRKAPSS